MLALDAKEERDEVGGACDHSVNSGVPYNLLASNRYTYLCSTQ